MGNFWTSFISTFRLISRIPLGKGNQSDFRYSGFFMPLIGVIVAAINCLLYYGFSLFMTDPFLIAVLILIIQYFLFNLFHFDGLLDSADAFFCFSDKEKRLAILKDVHIGSFAFFCGFFYLAVKLYLLFKGIGSGVSSTGLIVLLAYPVTGRIAAAFLPLFLKPASPRGLGALFADYKKGAALLGAITSLGCISLGMVIIRRNIFHSGIELIFIAFSFIPALIIVYSLYRKKLGGITGDGFGMAIELGELFHLIVFFIVLQNSAGGTIFG